MALIVAVGVGWSDESSLSAQPGLPNALHRTSDGASRSRTFARKVEAEQFVTSTEHRKLTGDYVDPMAARVLFEDYSAAWLQRKRATTRPGTAATFESHLRKHITPRFGRFALSEVTRESEKDFAGEFSGKVAPTTARAVVFTLAAVLREAVNDNRISRNPAERV